MSEDVTAANIVDPDPSDVTELLRNSQAHVVDLHVGGRLRERRLKCGLTCEELDDKLSLPRGDCNRYETGTGRVSASAIYSLAQVLDVPISYFFEDLSQASER